MLWHDVVCMKIIGGTAFTAFVNNDTSIVPGTSIAHQLVALTSHLVPNVECRLDEIGRKSNRIRNFDSVQTFAHTVLECPIVNDFAIDHRYGKMFDGDGFVVYDLWDRGQCVKMCCKDNSRFLFNALFESTSKESCGTIGFGSGSEFVTQNQATVIAFFEDVFDFTKFVQKGGLASIDVVQNKNLCK